MTGMSRNSHPALADDETPAGAETGERGMRVE